MLGIERTRRMVLEDPLGITSNRRILHGEANRPVVAPPGARTSKMEGIVHGEANRVLVALPGTIQNKMEEEVRLGEANREVVALPGIPISKMEILLGKQASLCGIVTVEEEMEGLVVVGKQVSLHGTREGKGLVLVEEVVGGMGKETRKRLAAVVEGPGVAMVEEGEEEDLAEEAETNLAEGGPPSGKGRILLQAGDLDPLGTGCFG